jgi:hypothetical protein
MAISLKLSRNGAVGFVDELSGAIFAKQKTKKAQQENDRHVIKATKEISMQHLILLAVVSMMVLYVLIIVGCLCYVGRHGRRTS